MCEPSSIFIDYTVLINNYKLCQNFLKKYSRHKLNTLDDGEGLELLF